MPDDPKLTILLSEYETTARNLASGGNVSAETINRYHGLTGQLLCHAVKSLWSQAELATAIDAGVAARCSHCENTQAIRALRDSGRMPGATPRDTLVAAVAGNLRAIVICLTIIIGAAIIRGQVTQLADLIRGVAQ
jgi:hypothetical protein